jgi:hypothetical protein
MFNPHASVSEFRLEEGRFCLIVDDALLDPDRMVQYAIERRSEFSAADSGFYPGVCLAAPPALTASLAALFRWQVRRRFDARRCIDVLCRFSLVTLPPEALSPLQSICHRDDSGLDPKLSMQASVLYLFHDESLGGTSFYVPTRSSAETDTLFRTAAQAPADVVRAKYEIEAGYIHDNNPYFRRIGAVSAQWNRLIFYDGSTLHSGDIPAPSRLSSDPLSGRLTLNGFFTCRRHLT